MKLNEVFVKEMSLPGQPQELSPDEIKTIVNNVYPALKTTGKTTENLEIYSADMGNDGLFFALIQNNNVLTWLNVVLWKSFPDDPSRKTLWVKRSYTPPRYRRKGYSEALYFGLSKMGYRVVSDDQLSSPGSRELWQKFAKRGQGTVKHWDTEQETFIDPNSGINVFNNKRIRHVLEHHYYPNVPTIGTKILGEMTFWTHPDVISGKFEFK